MAADRYISREWLLKTLAKYKDIGSWNTEVCDADTISRVLDVVENAVNGAPSIGPRQCANKILTAKKHGAGGKCENAEGQCRACKKPVQAI